MSSIDREAPGIVRVGRGAAAAPATTRASVAIGFGSPAGDSGVTRLDLNDILVRHPEATFLMRVAGDALRELGIGSGDLVVVDRAIEPAHGQVVVAVVDDEFVCRRLHRHGGQLRLQGTAPGTPDLVAGDGSTWQVWGVVTQAIRSLPT